ncbi:hypothetical protein QJS10_CPA06g01058 [Acorus calamus]|uniref:Uncharacterized protein n=1 Tax=Acorus calamus TaxID=4465 RepID=A0AAV9EKK9_ACOCL|nr:hypothetical protein QJS10_CPA06g01058 [Acorus calamus]
MSAVDGNGPLRGLDRRGSTVVRSGRHGGADQKFLGWDRRGTQRSTMHSVQTGKIEKGAPSIESNREGDQNGEKIRNSVDYSGAE